MDEIRYLISDASKKVDVETHVLRYWEEELGLSIPRNEMGHRYYTEFHIRLFCQVKKLKDKGYQLKAIKVALQQIMAQNQEIVNTADILEQDISKTLQENPRLGFLYRISVDKSEETRQVIQKEILQKEPSNIARMSDYSRLEPENRGREINKWESKDTKNGYLSEESSDSKVRKLADTSENLVQGRKNNWREGKEWDQADSKRASENQLDHKGKINESDKEEKQEESQEIEEKDGQIDMKGKRKNRNKPSAWERRNGVVNTKAGLKANLNQDNKTADAMNGPKEKEGEKNTDEVFIMAGEPGGLIDTQTLMSDKGETEKNRNQEEYLAEERGDLEHSQVTALAISQERENGEIQVLTQEEKMEQFQRIMNHIMERALEANNEKLSRDISVLVKQKLTEDLEDFMRIRDEREEERFRHLDEIIRSYQRESQSKAEAAAAKVPFFRKKRFGNGKQA
jgi:DNA-binding transcriptional MerR regulator